LGSVAAAALVPAGSISIAWSKEAAGGDAALIERFRYLSQNGNSNCSREFMASIATIPATTRLQGSCCAPMDAQRYLAQRKGLRKFADVAEIPGDPYDISAGLAQKLLPYYTVPLSAKERAIFDYAMANSDEKGPCCCQCWRWHLYGGLGKFLIHERGFDGRQVVEVWNLSNGCGGPMAPPSP
jgi:hypothetical protein